MNGWGGDGWGNFYWGTITENYVFFGWGSGLWGDAYWGGTWGAFNSTQSPSWTPVDSTKITAWGSVPVGAGN